MFDELQDKNDKHWLSRNSCKCFKNKSSDECLSAKNVKKARKAEVNCCPSNPAGETDEGLEEVRVELLNDV